VERGGVSLNRYRTAPVGSRATWSERVEDGGGRDAADRKAADTLEEVAAIDEAVHVGIEDLEDFGVHA
jgi:hypothetical protein